MKYKNDDIYAGDGCNAIFHCLYSNNRECLESWNGGLSTITYGGIIQIDIHCYLIMEKLKAEIARKKAEAEALRAKAKGNSTEESASAVNESSNSRFIRQGDRIAHERDQLEQKQRKLDEDREDQQRKRQKVSQPSPVLQLNASTTETTSLNNHLTDKCVDDSNEDSEIMKEIKKLTKKELTAKLRQYGQPVTLFGESESDCQRRLIKHLNDYGLVDNYDNFVETGSHGSVDDIDVVKLEEEDLEAPSSSSSKPLPADKIIVVGYNPNIHYHTMPNISKEQAVYCFFKSIVKEWEKDLERRPDVEKLTAKGKLETRSFKNCFDYIRPLFKMCKKQTLPFDILTKLFLMVTYCEEGNFLKANDEYIKTAIGNAAWPIGLTMVGIHERSGRERISTSKIAHVMNNEFERKYLTSVKRLMTYAQNKRPDVPPSMKVLN